MGLLVDPCSWPTQPQSTLRHRWLLYERMQPHQPPTESTYSILQHSAVTLKVVGASCYVKVIRHEVVPKLHANTRIGVNMAI